MEIPYGYCQCGCGEKTRLAVENDAKNNLTKGQPMRFINHHHRRKSGVEYIVDAATGCWVWQRATKYKGYGMLRVNGKAVAAHRHVYERETGRAIPEGLHLDHLCRNPPCVNPDHLQPVTHTENLRRGIHAKLSMEKARAIRASKSSLAALAAEYGVSESCIRTVRKGQTWKEPA